MIEETSWWDNIVWVILFIFLIPSSLAVAAWGSLPGQRLYQIKLFTERAGSVLAYTDEAQSRLQVALTGKRLDEATQLLADESSGEGLEYLRAQVAEAKKALEKAPNGEVRAALAMQYVDTLENASHQLEQQRQIISASQNTSSPPPKPASRNWYQNATQQPVQQVIVVNQITHVTQVIQVIQQIDQTQATINSALSDARSMSQGAQTAGQIQNTPTATPIPTATPNPTNTPVPTAAPETPASVQSFTANPEATVTQAPHDNRGSDGNSSGSSGSGGSDQPTP